MYEGILRLVYCHMDTKPRVKSRMQSCETKVLKMIITRMSRMDKVKSDDTLEEQGLESILIFIEK